MRNDATRGYGDQPAAWIEEGKLKLRKPPVYCRIERGSTGRYALSRGFMGFGSTISSDAENVAKVLLLYPHPELILRCLEELGWSDVLSHY